MFIKSLNKNYSHHLLELIRNMLAPNEQDRPNWITLSQNISDLVLARCYQ